MGSLAQQNGFDRALSHNLRSEVTQQSLTRAREECNKYDLTAAAACFSFAIIMIGSGGLLLVISYLFAVPVFVSGGRPEASKRNLNFQGATWHQF